MVEGGAAARGVLKVECPRSALRWRCWQDDTLVPSGRSTGCGPGSLPHSLNRNLAFDDQRTLSIAAAGRCSSSPNHSGNQHNGAQHSPEAEHALAPFLGGCGRRAPSRRLVFWGSVSSSAARSWRSSSYSEAGRILVERHSTESRLFGIRGVALDQRARYERRPLTNPSMWRATWRRGAMCPTVRRHGYLDTPAMRIQGSRRSIS